MKCQEVVVAEKMDLRTATVLVKALFNEYYNDNKMTVSVKQMDKVVNDMDEDEKPWLDSI